MIDQLETAVASSATSSASSTATDPSAAANNFFVQAWEAIKEFFSPKNLADVGIKLVIAIVLIIACHYIVKLINWSVFKGLSKTKKITKKMEAQGKKPRKPINYSVIYFIQALVRTLLYLLIFVIILAMFGLNFSGLGAILAGAIAGVSLSLQDVISSFAYGVIILTTSQFKIGDYIMLSNGIEGTVSKINLLTTEILTVPKEMIYIPNNVIGKGAVINTSTVPVRMVQVNFTVPSSSDIDQVKELAIGCALKDPLSLKSPTPNVIVTDLKDKAIVLQLRVYVNNDDFWTLGWNLNEAIAKKLREVGIIIGRGSVDVKLADQKQMSAEALQDRIEEQGNK
ncbi:MAG TPA: hypothetical protein DEA32_02035 [Firmicutes bacterium]|nr:hypothetical protein [Bacillota bacterium]